jgi:undecaprenyl-diphosphatase
MNLPATIAGLHRVLKQETVVIAAVLLIVGGLWTFIEIVDEIEGGETEEVDVWVAGLLRSGEDPRVPIGPDWLITATLDATALGSAAVLTIIVVLVAGFLAMQRSFRSMGFVIIASLLGAGLSMTLKNVFGRQRPDETLHLVEVSSASFPSGHAMLSAVVYLTLGVVLAGTRSRRREKLYIMLAAFLLTGIVGLSRVYLGVHYATDVLGGWSIGLCWAMLCLLAAHYLNRQHRRSGPRGQSQPTFDTET